MSDFVVVPNRVSGWDVMHDGDPVAVSNHSDPSSAVVAAKRFLAEDGKAGAVRMDTSRSHGIDDTSAGMRSTFFVLAGLFAVAVLVLVITSLASAASGL